MLIIAEIGSNFHSYQDLVKSIEAAKEARADVVKFQCFSEKSLYGFGDDKRNIPIEWLVKLREVADQVGIEMMCTAFDVETFSHVDKLVRRHKIASSELRHVELLDAVIKSAKPVLISIGGHKFREVKRTIEHMGSHSLLLLYCCNAYPSKMHHLGIINELKSAFGKPVGYSDHSIDIFTPYVAVKHYNAVVIEKHVRLPHIKDTPDAPHSITFEAFKEMVYWIKDEKPPRHPNEQEYEAVIMHNRRLVALQNLNIGDALQFGRNFGIYRSKEKRAGLDPEMWVEVDGKRAASGLLKGQPIGATDYK